MVKENTFRNRILLKVVSKLFSSRIATFLFDPFIPKLISFYLSQNLKKWKTKGGMLESYEVEVQRIGRLYYKVRLHVLAKKKETQKVLAEYISKSFKSFLNNQ